MKRFVPLLLALCFACSTLAVCASAEEITPAPGSANLPVGDLGVKYEAESIEVTREEVEAALAEEPLSTWAATKFTTGEHYKYLTEGQKAAYMAYCEAAQDVENCGFVTFDEDEVWKLSKDDVQTAVYAATYDHPEIFWAGTKYVTQNYEGHNYRISIAISANTVCTRSATELATMQASLETKAQEILDKANVDEITGDAYIALAVHDALIDSVSYDYDAANDSSQYLPHTAYNAIVEGKAVCDGYSLAYTYLLEKCGITSALIASDSLIHAWSIVQLDDEAWYETDSTWDDTTKGYSYYDLTTALMNTRHGGVRNSTGTVGLLPIAYGTKYTYTYLSTTTPPTSSPSTSTSPNPSTSTSPNPSTSTSPNPSTSTSPNPTASTSPNPTATTSPKPTTTTSPAPAATNTPKPVTTPTPTQAPTPEPTATAAPDGNGSQAAGDGSGTGDNNDNTGDNDNTGTPDTTGVEGFVDRLYSVCLGRPADAAGKADWVSQLTSYQISGTKAAYGFIFSEEFINKNYSNADFVEQLYQAFMGRASDEGGKADWVSKLDAGTSREEVFDGFANSVEFDNICNSYGIVSKDIETFVTRLYSVCLDRQPDNDGLADWAGRLRSGAVTGKAAASGFVFSEEFTNKNYSNADYVEHLYAAFMGRASDEGGKTDWVSKLDAGTTREEVFNGFADSAEFDNICSSYGIVRG